MALRDVCLVAAFGGAAKVLKRASAGRCRQHSHNPSRREPSCNTEPLAECQQLSQNWRADQRWEFSTEMLTPWAPASKDTEFSSLEMTANVIPKTPAEGNLGGFWQCKMPGKHEGLPGAQWCCRNRSVPQESTPHQLELNTEYVWPLQSAQECSFCGDRQQELLMHFLLKGCRRCFPLFKRKKKAFLNSLWKTQ